jgi:gamma-F420-2:alpha-L-glutamate ligase
MIVKTLSGSYGSGVFMVENRKQFVQMMKMAELTRPSYNIIIQECIEDSFGRDLRVLVVNGKVAGCMMRQSIDGDFRANLTRGGEAIPYQIDDDIEWIGGECARLLNLDIAGVDLLFDEGKYVICEVNSAPGFEGMEKYTKINIAEKMVDFISKKVGNQ